VLHSDVGRLYIGVGRIALGHFIPVRVVNRRFLRSSELTELRLPQPLTGRRVCPPPRYGGGAHSLAREGLGESQFRRGDIHCGILYIYDTYFVGPRFDSRL
jgi:hypothetical protein